MPGQAITIGIDISKDHLDVALYPGGETRRFLNARSGHTALLRWLGKQVVARIVFEATGPYHRDLERRLEQAGLPFAKVNPRQARRFAEATGKLAKTDRVDALMLARFGVLLEPQSRPARSENLVQLAELVAGRRILIKDRTATLNRLKTLGQELLKRHARHRLRQIEAHLTSLNVAIDAVIAADPVLTRRLAILTSIPGLGEITAQALIADMPELGTMDERQTAALAGLAPITRQSGKWQGKSFIQGGRSHLRQALYMPALVAMRFNPDLKSRYDALVTRGKHAKVAITAVMRRLVVIANALLRDDRTWTPKVA
ncbi:IS110 family RNA-guided transposase [Nguyenibacter vanlangensis]|uniref:IS110 family transposase n=1 Tax=Nguyenibacter vanlangensis TaxID=1216886 RepID=A0A7Y7M6H4_9PROT|nr:IS110 family transposase [Nguyenibacter vanlangensis]NVN10721.1 IS110 family transposase [Nguyenibacter vanlangensis]